MTARSARRAPALIALLYVVFAGGWIVVSGNLLTLSVDDPNIQSRIELIKGLLFVAVTGALLYALLRVWGRFAADSDRASGSPLAARSTIRRLVPVAVVLALIGPGIGFAIVRIHGPQVEKSTFADLQAIAVLKTRHIEGWLDERRGDAVGIANDKAFVERVAEWQRTGAERQRTPIYDRLESLCVSKGYESVLLFDSRGRIAVTAGDSQDTTESIDADVARALTTGTIRLNADLVRRGAGIHLDIAVPLAFGAPANRTTVGAVLLRVHPERSLFSAVHEWPTASRSGEIVVARNDDAFVTFVAGLRHGGTDAQQGKYPITDPNLPAAAALRDEASGTMRGVDYRGVPVLAAFRPVAGTDWRLVAKIDLEEVMAPLERTAFWIAFAAFLAASAAGAGMLVFWGQERRLHRLELQAQSDRLLSGFYNLPFIGMAVSAPDTKRFIRFNDRLCDIFGYSREELATKSWAEITHPDDLAADVAEFERILRGDSDSYSMDKRYIRKDGAVVFASMDVKCVRKSSGAADYFVAMIQDITDRVRSMEKIAADRARIKATFVGTVDLIGTLSDFRDPYTTGHERRVATIAVAVGREMGLDDDRLEGLRIASELHDVGKINIPMDILIKPTRLSAVEFQFVETHAQIGYDILKEVEFPWPVADVALQHHERWDGSGYPRGLRGDAARLEARIVAVADVVEAMASHRPYRPALGIDKALAEIESGRGALYDPGVADACLRLFREKGYAIPD